MPHCSLRFSLKTRWTTRSEQRTVFTDSLHLYVCGLASRHCTPALVQLAKASGRAGAQSWVQTRQALILTLLKTLCLRNTLTGPKVASSYDCSGNFRLPFPLSAHFDSDHFIWHIPRYWSYASASRRARNTNWPERLWVQDSLWSCATSSCYPRILMLWHL